MQEEFIAQVGRSWNPLLVELNEWRVFGISQETQGKANKVLAPTATVR